MEDLKSIIAELCSKIDQIQNTDEKVSALNYVRGLLHEVSPMKNHPVDYVFWEKSEHVEVNEYNPNRVAPPEMELLKTSIKEDGYTMPIVSWKDTDKIKIVDGFHRRECEITTPEISQATHGYVPLTQIRGTQTDLSDRMASTIRHNRARGTHNIELMSTIVAELVEMGKGDRWICNHIGMSADELLRLKQITGLAALFRNQSFSKSWDAQMEEE